MVSMCLTTEMLVALNMHLFVFVCVVPGMQDISSKETRFRYSISIFTNSVLRITFFFFFGALNQKQALFVFK